VKTSKLNCQNKQFGIVGGNFFKEERNIFVVLAIEDHEFLKIMNFQKEVRIF